jgi:adenine-specific DNA-methyltransferase
MNVRSKASVAAIPDALWAAHDFRAERSTALGQRMTPSDVAALLASLPSARRKQIELLDPGAGLGALTAAYVARLLARRGLPVQRVRATAVEVDPLLLGGLRETLDACKRACAASGVDFAYRIVTDEFVSSVLRLVPKGELLGQRYDCVLMNPPYAKLNTNTSTYRLLRDQGVRVTNWYAAFVVAALAVLADSGELVAITPRSFCNGTYFRPFRRALLSATSLRRIHVFESRSAAFRRDDVLQETVIFHVRRSAPHDSVVIASSGTPTERPRLTVLPYERVVWPRDPEMFIRIPTHGASARALPGADHKLDALGLAVSTGPVVDFRARDHLLRDPATDSVPLIYPMHFSKGRIEWPKPNGRKYNAIRNSESTARLLVPNERYVLVRRFSTKEELRRVVAAVYEPVGSSPVVGLENHLNYFHANGAGLDRDLAWGLALFLNSTAVDRHLREFSGHTQVNAGDLRSLSYPTADRLREWGREVQELPTQEEIDARIGTEGLTAA